MMIQIYVCIPQADGGRVDDYSFSIVQVHFVFR